jgi:hypothetical protein
MPQTASQPLSMNVLAAAVVPLVITTLVMPNAQVGVPYSQQLTATGGTIPYTWSIIAGALPAGLSLDPVTGIISGTPLAATVTPAAFTAQVVDSGA